MDEQKKLDDVIKVISPSSTGVAEFGSKFIDDYITVVEIALKDEWNSFSWFVFDNEFGKKKLQAIVNGKKRKICNERDFFRYCIKD